MSRPFNFSINFSNRELDSIIRLDLIDAYDKRLKHSENDYDGVTDALRKIIKYYSATHEWKEFIEEYGE